MHLFTLYFLDSGGRIPSKYPWEWGDYDYLRESQIDWFLASSQSIKPIERPFTPDGAEDLGKIWATRYEGGKHRLDAGEQQNKKLAKPNAMMFFHIPLQESTKPIDTDPETGEEIYYGDKQDEEGYSNTNGGFFEKGLLKAWETPQEYLQGDEDQVEHVPEVKIVGHGHNHSKFIIPLVLSIHALAMLTLYTYTQTPNDVHETMPPGFALVVVEVSVDTARLGGTAGSDHMRLVILGKRLSPGNGPNTIKSLIDNCWSGEYGAGG